MILKSTSNINYVTDPSIDVITYGESTSKLNLLTHQFSKTNTLKSSTAYLTTQHKSIIEIITKKPEIMTVPSTRKDIDSVTLQPRFTTLSVEKDTTTNSDLDKDTDNSEILKPRENMQKLIRKHETISNTQVLIVMSNIVFTSTVVLLLFSIIIYIILKEYKKTNDPLNYKNNCRNADEEFSEVRFLTSDEILDFTLVTPETIDNSSLKNFH
jgi:hypothetical protein